MRFHRIMSSLFAAVFVVSMVLSALTYCQPLKADQMSFCGMSCMGQVDAGYPCAGMFDCTTGWPCPQCTCIYGVWFLYVCN